MTRLALLALLTVAAGPPDEAVVARVDDRAIVGRDLKVYFALRGVPDTASPAFRKQAVEELIDRELIRRFLERHKTQADPEQLAAAVRAVKERLATGGKDPGRELESFGVSENELAAQAALTIAWRQLAGRAITDAQIRERFTEDRRRYDGTRLRVAQILRKYEPGESAANAPRTTARLVAVRKEIESGKTTFAAAAKAHSQAPSAADGGETGWIGPVGDMPAAVVDAAYGLAEGATGEVVLSPFGAHLVKVLDVEPGDLSLEDARPAIFEELSRAMWDRTVAAERKGAKITVEPLP